MPAIINGDGAVITRLLLRSARAFNCTPEGVTFYERSKRILHAVEQAVAEVSNDEQDIKGIIRIAAPHCFGETILPEALTLVRATYPQLDLELVLNDRIVDLVTEGVDISFRLGQLGEGALIARQLGQLGRVLVAAPGYLRVHVDCGGVTSRVEGLPDDEVAALLKSSLRA